MDLVIDRTHYPVESGRRSNLRHRPIGLGVQGMADLFMKIRVPFESDDARRINTEIFETIYHASLTESVAMAKVKGTYETFGGSPTSLGTFQFDMWGVTPSSR